MYQMFAVSPFGYCKKPTTASKEFIQKKKMLCKRKEFSQMKRNKNTLTSQGKH